MVTTTCFRFISLGGLGDAPRLVCVRDRWAAGVDAQNPQFRVHTLPRIMKVAVPRAQHSPMFGQRASSQTVFRASSRRMCFVVGVGASDPEPHLQPLRPTSAWPGVLGNRVAERAGLHRSGGRPDT